MTLAPDTSHVTASERSSPAGISKAMTLLLAFACGALVANLYYAQPLLATIAGDLHVSTSEAGLIVTITQIGYAIGLVAIVPLGDILPRRTVVAATITITVLGLVAMASAPTIGWVLAASVIVGVTSVVAQILVPLAAGMAREHERGRVVGIVMSGLLIGILLARTVSGLVAAAAGWRTVYVIAAGAMVLLSLVLWRALPRESAISQIGYRRLLSTLAEVFREEAIVRRRALFGALGFAGFSALWTTIAFLLAGAPYHYGEAVIGLFGLLGAAGATMASVAGRLADAGRARITRGMLLSLYLLSFGALDLGRHSLAWLIVGIMLLDLAVQGVHILNQSEIYAIRPEWRSRMTTVYMTSYFIGGATGSAVAAALYGADGWSAVCVLGAVLAALALVAWASERPATVARRATDPTAP